MTNEIKAMIMNRKFEFQTVMFRIKSDRRKQDRKCFAKDFESLEELSKFCFEVSLLMRREQTKMFSSGGQFESDELNATF